MKNLNLNILQKIPCITRIIDENKPLWGICLSEVWVPLSLKEWKSSLDSLNDLVPSQTLFINPKETEQKELMQIYGFPIIELPTIPTISMINNTISECFDKLYSGKIAILRQSDISKEIANRISYWSPDIAVLLVLDGLSFYDLTQREFPKDWDVKYEPCFVDGLTNTESGMPRLVGSPCLAHLLFSLGYKQRLGFSYWERSQNRLTDEIFAEFPTTQLHRVTTFEEIIQQLDELNPVSKLFIQIVRNGMESYCHHYRERPNIIHIIDNLKNDIEGIVKSLKSTSKTFRLFITSDHGILWFDRQKVSPFDSKDAHTRYIEGETRNEAEIITIDENNQTYTMLVGDETIAKNRNVMEWGFHGGLSAQESIVPFIDIIPNNQSRHPEKNYV